MLKDRHSRYFLFSKVNPREGDFLILSDGLKKIRADYSGYRLYKKEGREYLKGFFVLSQDCTRSYKLHFWFPNFLIQDMPLDMHSDFESFEDVAVTGAHPYLSCKRNLFGCGLTSFMSG